MPDFDSIIDEFNTLAEDQNNKINAIQKEMTEKFKNTIRPVFDSFFKKHPEVLAVGWTQYTPYFNDGEECVFSVNTANFCTVEENLSDVDEWENDPMNVNDPFAGNSNSQSRIQEALDDPNDRMHDFYERLVDEWNESREKYGVERITSLNEDMVKINKFLRGMDEVMKMAFGDHCQVVVTRDGIEVEEYDHD